MRLRLIFDLVFDEGPAPGAQATTSRHNLKTGGQIPSDLLAEIDRKVDDGSATGGVFRFSAYDGGAGVPVGSTSCYLAAAPNAWNATAPVANCGGATLF